MKKSLPEQASSSESWRFYWTIRQLGNWFRRSSLFTHGELGRLILDCLRKAGEPLPTAAIVAYVAEAIGQGEAGRKVVYKTVATNLRYMAARHRTVAKTGEREAARWSLA